MKRLKDKLLLLAYWIRDRLLDGYDALVAYRWARVLFGFFAFIGRSVYNGAARIQDGLSAVLKLDLDKIVDRRLAQAEAKGGRIAAGRIRRFLAAYDRAYNKYRMGVKIVLSTMLLTLSMALLLLFTNRYTALMCAGMGFSWLSDAMLMEYPPVRRGVRQYFLWGMGGFACAMALYSGAFLALYARAQTSGPQGTFVLRSIYAVFALCGLLIWLFSIAFNKKQMLALRLGTLGYGLVVSLMAASACAVAVATAGQVWYLIPGAVCFFVSDMMIALFNFGSIRVRHPDSWIWLFYAPAQLLLILGAGAAAALIG